MDTEKIIILTLFLCFVIAGFGIPKLKKMLKINKLYEYVGWCLTDDSMGASSLSKLMQCIEYTQAKTKTPLKYCILESQEKKYAREIFKRFQIEWARSYFNDKLKMVSHKKRLDYGDYFCAALFDFLSEHECDDTFLDHDMYTLVSKQTYGSAWRYDAIYELTDFAIVFHKLVLISYAGCIHSESINFDKRYSQKNYEAIKRVLDTNQIEMSRV